MVESADCIPADPEGETWDVVVIGTGAGGGTAGFSLAQHGRSVLFIERGPLNHPSVVRNPFAPPTISKEAPGWWPGSVRRHGDTDGSSQAWIGCGIGGSTAVFSMTMDRLRPIDLTPRQFAPKQSAATVPTAWPIGYDELEPYYREAEELYRVRGTDDPLTPTGGPLLEPCLPSDAEAAVHEMLKQSGLHPYRLHSACERIPGCVGHCFGQICTRRCRNDAGRICVAPALENHGAHILPNCHVISLDAAGRTVQSAVCLWNGRRVAIRARIFVLALNAMLTPALLLRSANAAFPDGLGNSSGAVGRYLMYHVSDTIAVHFDWPRGFINGLLNHGLSLNDLYVHGGMKLGNIHAHAIVNSALRDATHSPDAAGTAVFHTIVEDFPSADNRVTLARDSDDGVHWHYDVSDELRMRSELLVNAFADALRPKGRVKKLEPSCILNMGHVCGTCRFGTDPHTSVLAADNRIHDLDNAYVVDASFFPSSGGMNPSLTIVANSLRVSALIARR